MDKIERILAETRKRTRAKDHWSKDGFMKCIGAMTERQHQQMTKECGDDIDKQNRWLRDHPQHLTASPKAHGMPKKKIIIPLS
jgi:hypothetical protein